MEVLSLNSALSKLWCDHLMLIISDGSFRLSVRMPFRWRCGLLHLLKVSLCCQVGAP